jgi:hypothetical protein
LRKIAIGIPAFGDMKANFVTDLVSLVAYSGAELQRECPTDIQLIHSASSILPAGRTDIVKSAIRAGCEGIFWLDADMRFPPDALVRLLSHRKQIVGANYTTRREPYRPTAWAKGKRIHTTDDDHGLTAVVHVGFGCLWTHIDTFKAIGEPYFMFGFEKNTKQYVGEDVYFCHQAALRGYQPFIDHDLSRDVGHIGDIVLYPGHAEIGAEKLAPLDFDNVQATHARAAE